MIGKTCFLNLEYTLKPDIQTNCQLYRLIHPDRMDLVCSRLRCFCYSEIFSKLSCVEQQRSTVYKNCSIMTYIRPTISQGRYILSGVYKFVDLLTELR